MSNDVFLCCLNENSIDLDEDTIEEATTLVASYCIPVFWCALFDSSSVIIRAYRYDEDEDPDEYPVFFDSKDAAIKRLVSRKEKLLKILPNELHSYYNEFLKKVNDFDCEFFFVETNEFWAMDEEAFEADIKILATAIDTSNKKYIQALFNQAAIDIDPNTGSFIYDSLNVSNTLMGYEW